MRVRYVLPVLAAFLTIAAPAQAAAPHVVRPGETLWSIAAANNLTTRTVAAYNGLSENSQVVLGSTIMVPSTVEGYASLQKAGRLREIERSITEEKVFTWLKERNTVE